MADIHKLPSDAKEASEKVKEWLLRQTFVDLNGLRFYSSAELVEECEELLRHLPAKCKEDFDPQNHDTRVTAIHVHMGMTVPVEDGSGALLIPVCVGDGATLDSQVLHELDYAELKGRVVATPEFYAVLLLSRVIT